MIKPAETIAHDNLNYLGIWLQELLQLVLKIFCDFGGFAPGTVETEEVTLHLNQRTMNNFFLL